MNTNYIADTASLMDGQSKHRKRMLALDVCVKIRHVLNNKEEHPSKIKEILRNLFTTPETVVIGPRDLLELDDLIDNELEKVIRKVTDSFKFHHEIGDVYNAVEQYIDDRISKHMSLKIISSSIENMSKIIIDEEFRINDHLRQMILARITSEASH